MKEKPVGPGTWHFQDWERLKTMFERGRRVLSFKGQQRLRDYEEAKKQV